MPQPDPDAPAAISNDASPEPAPAEPGSADVAPSDLAPPGLEPPDGPGPTLVDAANEADGADAGRRLFAYVVGGEWLEYRAILAVFADTFFAEFTPEEVHARLAAAGTPIEAEMVADRLESLRRWGNLAVSSSVGSPTSLSDYYRRRNRYLITSAGQEVFEVVEGVLDRADEVHDVAAGRLRTLRDALEALLAVDVSSVDPTRLADLVRDVFDPHVTFTSEITRFFAALNQWQSRYDLSETELTFFAGVLVTYVSERLDEIQRSSPPIAAGLDALDDRIDTIARRMERGLRGRVEVAGLDDEVAVSKVVGSSPDDWVHLRSWFAPVGGRPARLTQLRSDAIAAIRTLTLNLTRLSSSGVGGSSRRADLVRLAALFDRCRPEDAPRLAQAVLGLGGSVHLGTLGGDVDDPVATTTPWPEAPPAVVPVSVRERGDRANRGTTTPLRDRSAAQRLVRDRREAARAAAARIDEELVGIDLDGASVSVAALHRLQGLVGTTLAQLGPRAVEGSHVDGGLRCTVERSERAGVTVTTDEGSLRFEGLAIWVSSADAASGSRVPIAAGGS